MSAQYLYQVVFCSSRKGRAFRREIALSSNSALITAVEKLPPAYDAVIRNLQDPQEMVAHYRGPLSYSEGCEACPFCGNGRVFICDCRMMSCIKREEKSHHHCPSCDRVHAVKDADGFYASESGLIGNAQRVLPEQPENPYSRRFPPLTALPGSYEKALPGPDTGKRKEVEDKRGKLQRFLEDKRKKD